MPLPRLTAAAGLLLASLTLGHANLSETEAQSIARFGSESDVQNGLGYHKVGDKSAYFHPRIAGVALTLKIIFLNGRSCHEEIASADDSRGLTEDQMRAILNTEGSWHRGKVVFRSDRNPTGDTRGYEDWKRDDGQATARFWESGKADAQTTTGEMELSTKQYADAQAYYDKEDGAE
jgi:hypothetical protein